MRPASFVAWRWESFEVGRNGDHRLGDRAAKKGFRRILHFLQNEGADLARAIVLARGRDPGVRRCPP